MHFIFRLRNKTGLRHSREYSNTEFICRTNFCLQSNITSIRIHRKSYLRQDKRSSRCLTFLLFHYCAAFRKFFPGRGWHAERKWFEKVLPPSFMLFSMTQIWFKGMFIARATSHWGKFSNLFTVQNNSLLVLLKLWMMKSRSHFNTTTVGDGKWKSALNTMHVIINLFYNFNNNIHVHSCERVLFDFNWNKSLMKQSRRC